MPSDSEVPVKQYHPKRVNHPRRWAAYQPAAVLGRGVMLTPSVNVVQSAFPEEQQGEISGLSRSVSNLGSSLGTAIAGTILVSDLASGTGLTPWRWPHWP
jgi:predicted MFS family arabinose efflux permease